MGSLSPDEWLEQAERLSPGASIKVPHKGCSNSACLWIHHKEEGFSAYCFKCHRTGWKSHDACSITDYLDRKAAFKAQEEAKLLRGYSLPADFSHQLPVRASVWLASNGFTPTLARHYKVGFSEKLQRVILPVSNGTEDIGFTARGLYKNQPKYIERLKHNAVAYMPALRKSSMVVVTEDWLSGAVCSQVMHSYPLLGTSTDLNVLARLMVYDRVHVWLDPDSAGRYGTQKLIKELRLLRDVKIIKSKRDPKFYSIKDIKEILK